MIRERYRKEGPTLERYVRKRIGQPWYEWCEQSAAEPAYDVAQGTCDAEDLPDDIRKQCDEYKGMHYAVRWPMGYGK